MPKGVDWFADVPISLPAPPPSPAVVDLGGFGFGIGGICHLITAAAEEDLSMPTSDALAPPPVVP